MFGKFSVGVEAKMHAETTDRRREKMPGAVMSDYVTGCRRGPSTAPLLPRALLVTVSVEALSVCQAALTQQTMPGGSTVRSETEQLFT